MTSTSSFGAWGWGWGKDLIGGLVPPSVPGLQLWLDGSDITTLFQDSAKTTPVTADGDVVGAWADKSGNGNDVTQGTTANKPLYKTAIQNGLSIVRGDGISDILVTSAALLAGNADFSCFAVAAGAINQEVLIAQLAAGVGRTIFIGARYLDGARHKLFFNNGTSFQVEATTTGWDEAFHLLYSETDGSGNSNVRVDGGASEGAVAGQTWTHENTPLTIFAYNAPSPTSWIAADLGEVLIYSSYLSATNRQSVEDYLQSKWGTP